MVDRTRAIRVAAFASVILFAAIGFGIDKTGWRPPFWITTPSAAAFFGVFFRLYDRVLWRVSFGRFRLSRVPDLIGGWVGTIDIEGGPKRTEEGLKDVLCVVRIRQTWSQISVEFETPFTHSSSSMASLSASTFHYEYTVEPKVGTEYPKGMKPHGGMARLRFADTPSCAPGEMTGSFFNDQSYLRFGRYKLRRAEGDELEMWLTVR